MRPDHEPAIGGHAGVAELDPQKIAVALDLRRVIELPGLLDPGQARPARRNALAPRVLIQETGADSVGAERVADQVVLEDKLLAADRGRRQQNQAQDEQSSHGTRLLGPRHCRRMSRGLTKWGQAPRSHPVSQKPPIGSEPVPISLDALGQRDADSVRRGRGACLPGTGLQNDIPGPVSCLRERFCRRRTEGASLQASHAPRGYRCGSGKEDARRCDSGRAVRRSASGEADSI